MASSEVGAWVAVNSQCNDSAVFFILFSNYVTDIKFVNSLQDALHFAM